MAKRPFPLIQNVPVPKGTAAFEEQRQRMIAEFNDKVPEEYYIPQHFVDNPPRDVTGIPRASGILTPKEIEITEDFDAVGLATAIATRRFTSVEVATAFSKRAIICHQVSCCLNQWFPEEALERARALDDHLERTGKTVGPLHGVPVSIKQHMPIAGRSSDTGFVSSIVQDDSDALLMSILRKLGAVFYVKTMQPQAIMHLETDCHLGRTLNPYNINLSAGGSSGGESALIALRGSVLGVGTDTGGSIRGPAGKCGLYGFRPTSFTLPTRDFIRGGVPTELNIIISTGPLCRSLRDMDMFMREVLGQNPSKSDPRVIPIPWTGLKTENVPRPLKVGVMMSDGQIQPMPPTTRALEWAVSRLEASGLIDIKPFIPYKPVEAIKMLRQRLYFPDSGHAMKSALSSTGEPMLPLSAWIVKDAEAEQQMTATEITQAHLDRDLFRCAFAESWTEQDVDVVVCPVFVGPAPTHETSFYWNYSALWNLVDYPGAVFPTPIFAQKKGAESYDNAEPLSEEDAHVRKLWEEGDFEGAPIGLQLVARKHHDNLLFGALNVLKDLLQLS